MAAVVLTPESGVRVLLPHPVEVPDVNPGAGPLPHITVVRDAVTAAPITNAEVYFFQPAYYENVPEPPDFNIFHPVLAYGLTDGGGSVVFNGSPGTIHILVLAAGKVPQAAYNVRFGDHRTFALATAPLTDVGNMLLRLRFVLQGQASGGFTATDALVWLTSDAAGTTVVAGPMPVLEAMQTWLYVQRGTVYYLWLSSPALQTLAAPNPYQITTLAAGDVTTATVTLVPAYTAGSGTQLITATVTDVVTGNPVANARVWLTTNAIGQARTNALAYTDATGVATFANNADGTYYLFASGGLNYKPVLAQAVVVSGAPATAAVKMHPYRLGVAAKDYSLDPSPDGPFLAGKFILLHSGAVAPYTPVVPRFQKHRGDSNLVSLPALSLRQPSSFVATDYWGGVQVSTAQGLWAGLYPTGDRHVTAPAGGGGLVGALQSRQAAGPAPNDEI